MKVENDVGNEERGKGHTEFVFRREIDSSAKRDGGERREVREPGCARIDREARHNSVSSCSENKDESGNHLREF